MTTQPKDIVDSRGDFARDEPITPTRGLKWPRLRFGLRSLLLLPIVTTALLLLSFPKLLTGDYLEVTVKDVQDDDGRLRFDLETTMSSGTGFRLTYRDAPIEGFHFEGDITNTIPTWSKRGPLMIRLIFQPDVLLRSTELVCDVATVKPGETFHVTPDHPLTLAILRLSNGAHVKCLLQIHSESRLGL